MSDLRWFSPSTPSSSASSLALSALVSVGVLASARPAAAAPVGTPVDESIALHVTSDGFGQVGAAIEGLVPEALSIEASSGELACADSDIVPLAWSLDALDVLLSVDEVAFDTSDGSLDVVVYATLSSTESTLTVAGDCTVLTDLDETCGLAVPTTAVQVRMDLELAEAEGDFEVTVSETTLDISPLGNPLTDCTFASAVGTMLGQDPALLSQLIASLVEPELASLGPEVEGALEDALGALQLETEIDLLGTPLTLAIEPTRLTIDERGLIIGLGTTATPASTSACVDSLDGSDLRGSSWPEFGDTALDGALPYDVGLFLGADFLDHTLFNVWASGALCLDAGELLGSVVAGGLTTDFLGPVLGEPFQELFSESSPATLDIVARTPPRGEFAADGAPVHVRLDDLSVELVAELDHRQTRVFEVTGTADIGVAVDLEDNVLATGLDLPDPAVSFTETYHELLPSGFSGGLATLVGTFLETLIPADLLPSVAIPEVLGVQLDALVWQPSDDSDWQGGYLLLDTSGVTPIELSGCSLDGIGCDGGDLGVELDFGALLGCGDGADLGCDGSACATTGPPTLLQRAARGRLMLLLGLVVGAVLGRRQQR